MIDFEIQPMLHALKQAVDARVRLNYLRAQGTLKEKVAAEEEVFFKSRSLVSVYTDNAMWFGENLDSENHQAVYEALQAARECVTCHKKGIEVLDDRIAYVVEFRKRLGLKVPA